MRKFFLAALLVLSLFLFAACDVDDMGSLEDISRPYTGVYECEQFRYGGEDRTDSFEYLRLELEYGGAFTLSYKMKNGAEGELGGLYEADTVREEITFHAKQGLRSVSRTFPLENGAIRIEENILGRLIYAEFRM